ncbi:MAG: hypothetical protein GY782_08545 [Gammaproteobacteria bacterium]|nr:hypothetical protein [Gammaproteobacteria bacterium]
MAIETQGTKFYWSSSTAVSTSASAVVGKIISFSGPGGEAPDIDVTHLLSTAKEYIVGLRDEGDLSFSVIYEVTDVGHIALQTDRGARTKKKAAIDFSTVSLPTATAANGSRKTFDAYCKGFTLGGAVDDKWQADVTLRITGSIDDTVQAS